MSGKRAIGLLACVAASVLAAATAAAEVRTSVELTLLDALTRLHGDEAGFTAGGVGKLVLDTAPSETLRGQVALETRIGDVTELNVSRAYLRIRTPGWRVTHGLTPLAWGQGFFYNAADPIFGPEGSTEDLTAKELRDFSVWQSTLFIPLGPFTFVEGTLLAPELNVRDLINDPDAKPPAASDAAGGTRFVGRVGAAQIEAGYLYRGSDGTHNPFVSLRGNVLVDVYVAASAALPQEGIGLEQVEDRVLASAGLFHVMRGPGGSFVTARLEGLVRPGGRWEPGPAGSVYGIVLYPELVWNAGPRISLISRNFLSPIDLSALCALGADWKFQPGLSLLAFASAQLGERDDTWAWGRERDLTLTAGFRFVY
jgi:hypothetical protein